MIQISDSKTIILEDESYEIEINSDKAIDLTFVIQNNTNVLVNIQACPSLHISCELKEDYEAKILYWNSSKNELVASEEYNVYRNGDLTVAYGECNLANTNRDTTILLKEAGANAVLSSASLVNVNKEYRMRVVNEAEHTHGDMKNYAVVLSEGKLMIDAIGAIKKGAHRAESHQTSRALSFAEGQKATILPELLIDENDVQASHAMSMGRMDEDQLYYMMSRGLSIEDCTSLIATGYLLPIVDVVKDENLKETLKKELEGKIQELCSM